MEGLCRANNPGQGERLAARGVLTGTERLHGGRHGLTPSWGVGSGVKSKSSACAKVQKCRISKEEKVQIQGKGGKFRTNVRASGGKHTNTKGKKIERMGTHEKAGKSIGGR